MSLFFSAVPPSGRIIPRGHNPLEYRYTFWLSKRKSVLKGKNYDQSMMKLGSFETVQQFWQYYSFMKRPSKVDEACDLMLVSRSSFWSLEKSVKIISQLLTQFSVQIGNPASVGGRIEQGRGSLVDPCQATQHRQILGKCNYGHGRGTIHGWQ